MKKFAFLALLFFIFYIAAMYGSPALMVLFLAQIFFLAVMLLLSFYLKMHLTVSFPEQLIFAEAGRDFTIRINTDNSALLPVRCFKIRLTVQSRDTGEKYKRTVSGNCICGKGSVDFKETMSHLGICEIYLEWIRIYDYLTLFSWKKKSECKAEAVVFPPEADTWITKRPGRKQEKEMYREGTLSAGSSYDEVRQIREYRQGDPLRHIHWNQTARTGTLWIKEYDEETEGQVRLYLDAGKLRERSPDEKDCFYTLLSTVLRGILKQAGSVLVFWNETGQTIRRKEVSGRRGCRELFLILYRCQDRLAGWDDRRREIEKSNGICLTDSLSLYESRRLIRQFSYENLMQELKENVFNGKTGNRHGME